MPIPAPRLRFAASLRPLSSGAPSRGAYFAMMQAITIVPASLGAEAAAIGAARLAAAARQ